MSSLHAFQSATEEQNENPISKIAHHSWKETTRAMPSSFTGNTMGNRNSNSRNIDRFLTRSKRRKSPCWGSDSSTIFTESTGQSSQSSSTSPVPLVRKVAIPRSPIPATHPEEEESEPSHNGVPLTNTDDDINHDSSRAPVVVDQRETIGSVNLFMNQNHPQLLFPIDVDSLQEYIPTPPLLEQGVERGVFRCESNDDLQQPLPPRSPRRRVQDPPPSSSVRTRIVADSSTITERHRRQQQKQQQPHYARLPNAGTNHSVDLWGPIDVDSMEAYTEVLTEDESVDSLAMMKIIEDPDNSEESCDGTLSSSKPAMATRQRTSSSSLATSLSPDDISFQDEEEYDGHDDDEDVPLESLMRLDKLDLLAESDGDDDDYAQVHTHMKHFPVLDESEAERVLTGYCKGFEPPMESIDIVRQPRKNVPPLSPRPTAVVTRGTFEI